MNEGDYLEMTELVLQEKEINATIEALNKKMQVPLDRLRRTKALLDKAKQAFQQALAVVKPIQSDKMLAEGELELVLEKKSTLRQEHRLSEGGGIRPGTHQLVEQMRGLVGDPAGYRAEKEVRAVEVEAALDALKDKMDS